MADNDIDIADADERTRLIRPVGEDDSQWSRWLGGGKIPRQQQQRQAAPHSGSYYSSATNSTIGSEELGYIQREVLEEYEEMLKKEDYYGGKRHSSGKIPLAIKIGIYAVKCHILGHFDRQWAAFFFLKLLEQPKSAIIGPLLLSRPLLTVYQTTQEYVFRRYF